MQETRINLSKEQLATIINEQFIKENGANELFEIFINSLMKIERDEHISQTRLNGNKGNGYRQIIKSGIQNGLNLKIPRDRLSSYKPIILAIINENEEKVKELSFELYGKGLSTRQVSDVIEKIYGKSCSKTTISRISQKYSQLIEEWRSRGLEKKYKVIMQDALYINVRRERVKKEAYYILLGLKEDNTREIISIFNIPTESSLGWQEVLKEIKERGVEEVGLFVTDDLSGIDAVIEKEFPNSEHQKCTLHFKKNQSKHVRILDRKEFNEGLQKVFDPELESSPEEKINELKEYLEKWEEKYPIFRKVKNRPDLIKYFSYYRYHRKIRRMIYTTNWIERFNKSVRRTEKIRDSFPSPESAMILVGYVGMELGMGTYKYPINDFEYETKL